MNEKKPSQLFKKFARKIKVLHMLSFLVSVGLIIYFAIRTNNLDILFNDLTTMTTEWSLTEHSSFTNMLISQVIKKYQQYKIIPEEEKVLERMIEVKNSLESVNYLKKNSDVKYPINLDGLDYDSASNYLSEEILNKLTYKDLNLEKKQWGVKIKVNETDEKNMPRDYFQNSNSTTPKSYLFVPTQLVNKDINGDVSLSMNIKRGIVFSKIAEKHLSELLRKFPDARQAYFISINGFIRICSKSENPDFFAQYSSNFGIKYKRNFADRVYFDRTLEKITHKSSLYIDTAGEGIVHTASVSIVIPHLDIVGIIAVDFPISVEFNDLLTKVCSFESFPINKQKKYVELVPTGKLQTSDIEVIKKIDRQMLQTEVLRFDIGEGEKRFIYSVPKKDEVDFFIFDKNIIERNYVRFMLSVVSSLILIGIFTYLIYRDTLSRMKTEENQLQLISLMHSSYVITNSKSAILEYNVEFENLVDKKKLKHTNLWEYFSEESIKDYNYFIDEIKKDSSNEKKRFECPIEIITAKGCRKDAILISTGIDYLSEKGSRISIIIESESLEASVAEKYMDRISHILKTPLHSILFIADQLRRKTAKNRYDEYFNLLDDEISTVSNTTAKLLRVSKIEFNHLRPDFEKFDLSKLVNEVCLEFGPLAKKRRLKFSFNVASGSSISGDRDMIRIALENILDNALKYTLEGAISLNLYDVSAEAKIVIEDTGIGITESDCKRIFEKKFRCNHPVVNKSSGQGIGLYQCQKFIKLNGGKILVYSVPECLSRFTLIFPKKQ